MSDTSETKLIKHLAVTVNASIPSITASKRKMASTAGGRGHLGVQSGIRDRSLRCRVFDVATR